MFDAFLIVSFLIGCGKIFPKKPINLKL